MEIIISSSWNSSCIHPLEEPTQQTASHSWIQYDHLVLILHLVTFQEEEEEVYAVVEEKEQEEEENLKVNAFPSSYCLANRLAKIF